MAVAWHTENDLGSRETSRSPCLESRNGRTSSGDAGVGSGIRNAAIVERSVGANGVRPRTPHVIVHHFDPIQHVRKRTDIGHRRSRRIVARKRYNARRSAQHQLSRCGSRMLTKFLQEREEVGAVRGGADVTADTILVGVLPVKVETVEGVVGDEVGDGLDESGAVLGGSDVGGEELRS